MKIYLAFCSGKSILLNDPQKLRRYINLCKETPVPYAAIAKSVGYLNIIRAQFTFQSFNTEIFPDFNDLIARDLNELQHIEYNFYLQAMQNYLEVCVLNKEINHSFLDKVSEQILNGTYIQRAMFHAHYTRYFNKVYGAVQGKYFKMIITKLYQDQVQSPEELVWQLSYRLASSNTRNETSVTNEEKTIIQEVVQNYELISFQAPQFESFNSAQELLRLNSTLKLYLHNEEAKFFKLMLLMNKECQITVDQNLQQLNSFQLYSYMELLAVNKDFFLGISWDKLFNELLQRNLFEIPFQDLIQYLIQMVNAEQTDHKVIPYLIEHLYQNINLIDPRQYSRMLHILQFINTEHSSKFMAKLSLKINPRELPLRDISETMLVLGTQKRMDKTILDKYLAGISNRVKDIDCETAYGILLAINSVRSGALTVFHKIASLKYPALDNLPLQLQILHYYQIHDQKNLRVQTIQENLLKYLEKSYRVELMVMFIQVLVEFNPKNYITIISGLKKFVQRYLKEPLDPNDEQLEKIKMVLKQYYHIE